MINFNAVNNCHGFTDVSAMLPSSEYKIDSLHKIGSLGYKIDSLGCKIDSDTFVP